MEKELPRLFPNAAAAAILHVYINTVSNRKAFKLMLNNGGT
jgi:hypothetical protein